MGHHFAIVNCNYFGGSNLQSCGDTCYGQEFSKYHDLGKSDLNLMAKKWPCLLCLANRHVPHGSL